MISAPVAATPRQSTTAAPGARQPRDLSGVQVRMERTSCYGICPSYSVDIGGDGQVSYVGVEFVAKRGRMKGSADPAQINRLMDEAERIRLATLVTAPECAKMETDQATVILTVRDNGQTIKLTHYLGNGCYPKDLEDFEAFVDEVAGTRAWVRCETGFCVN